VHRRGANGGDIFSRLRAVSGTTGVFATAL
jgi:hypothetical protein